MARDELKEKAIIYGVNYLARPVGNFFKEGLNLGNPYGSLIYATSEIIKKGDNEYTRAIDNTVKFVGTIFYFSQSMKSLVNLVQGETSGLENLPFDLSMFLTSIQDVNFNFKEVYGSLFSKEKSS